MRLENKEIATDKQKRKLIDSYVTTQLTHDEYVSQNLELDQELLKIKSKKEELLAASESAEKTER